MPHDLAGAPEIEVDELAALPHGPDAPALIDVRSLRGGFIAWQRRGKPWVLPAVAARDGLDLEQRERHSRHLRLPEVGVAGQRRLLESRVLCVGAGGLGSPASLYLAAAGVGTISLVDDERVELSNLQRQIVHATGRIGMAKVESASRTLESLNPGTRLQPIEARLAADNALGLMAQYDVVLDGSDNLATRYLVNDTALRLGKPVVHGAVLRFEGHVGLFTGRPCYRCLFREAPRPELAASCAEAGVRGVRESGSECRFRRARYDPQMNTSRSADSDTLKSIARRVMRERGLLPEFSEAALNQAQSIAGAASTRPDIRDLRELPWASIDNDDSRDLDQLAVAQPVNDGAVRVLVAIADVDALVELGSPIDDHARINTTSVYTAAQIFPMLPEKLSTDLTSLREGQSRLAIVIEMTVGADGVVTQSDLYRAQVLNHAKLTYATVGAWLEGRGPPPDAFARVPELEQQLRTQDQVAQALRAVRDSRGALSLQANEARAVFEDGVLSDLRPDEKDRAKELIEDFMIAANGVTARYLAEHNRPSLRRVLHSPERWERIVALAADQGERLPAAPDVVALNHFLLKRRDADPARFQDLSLSVIKMLGSGEYAVEMPGKRADGHFGLAVRDYTHSTAPNRRFPDLLTQRLLKAALAGRPSPYSEAELQALAAHCTRQEDMATKVERQVRKSAAALLLAGRIGQRFAAIVTGASSKGTWVRISGPMAEGRVVRGFEGMDVGDAVRVELLRVDAARGFIDFARTD